MLIIVKIILMETRYQNIALPLAIIIRMVIQVIVFVLLTAIVIILLIIQLGLV